MRFLDQKEEVIDLELTPTGTRLLQLGAFQPASYCFFDDDVLYDSRWACKSGSMDNFETQNEIEARIQDVPRLQAIRAKFSVETNIRQDAGTNAAIAEYDIFQAWDYLSFMGASQLFADSAYFADMLGLYNLPYPQFLWNSYKSNTSNSIVTQKEAGLFAGEISSLPQLLGAHLNQDERNRLYAFYGPLGNMDYQSGDEMPTWSIEFLKSPITGSIATTGSMGEKVYEIYSDLQYKLAVKKTLTPEEEVLFHDMEDPLDTMPLERVGTALEDVNASSISLDGTYIEVVDDYLFLKVGENNTKFLKENFEIEIYKINDNGEESPVAMTNETRLFFDNPEIALSDVLSSDNPQLQTDFKSADWQAHGTEGATEIYTQRFVGFYFDILVDEQIPDEIFCKAMSEDVTTFDYLDKQMFDCVDTQPPPAYDPYGLPDDPTEACS